jgi:hypothetical protein
MGVGRGFLGGWRLRGAVIGVGWGGFSKEGAPAGRVSGEGREVLCRPGMGFG